jgi:hypothetical protein
VIGPRKTFYFFARKNKLRGSTHLPPSPLAADTHERSFLAFCFLLGIVLVFIKYPFFGMVVETVGFLNLFGCAPSPLIPSLDGAHDVKRG